MSILDRIVATKREEIELLKQQSSLADWQTRARDAEPPRDFLRPLQTAPPIRLIAEVKKASPSQGIIRADFDPVPIAQAYATAGASCISVLTDEQYFQGKLDYLQQIRQHVDLPLLRKDFILDPIQVWQARASGADAVLLIAECLDRESMHELHNEIVSAGMTALVEFVRCKKPGSSARFTTQIGGREQSGPEHVQGRFAAFDSSPCADTGRDRFCFGKWHSKCPRFATAARSFRRCHPGRTNTVRAAGRRVGNAATYSRLSDGLDEEYNRQGCRPVAGL